MKKRLFIIASVLLLGLATLGFKSDFFEIAKQVEIFTTLFKELNLNYVDETQPADLMDNAIKNMLKRLDPYTVYLNEQDVEEYKMKYAGSYSGIGALLKTYNDKLLVAEVYKNYPADKAGLRAGDELLKIGDVTVADAKEDAAALLKGAINTRITVTYKRQGKEYTASLTLQGVETDAVLFSGKAAPRVGYIALSTFNEKTTSQMKEALERLKADGAEQLILDLRGNPGGLLTEAINTTGLFVPKGSLVVTTKSNVKKFNRSYHTSGEPMAPAMPLIVLVDEKSASASEIVSGALQDLDRAVVVGTQSFGKGLVQRPVKLVYGAQLKVTISRYYTPSGRCIQAIDYQQRDTAGNAVHQNRQNAFKTRNGRTVYDAGGVTPDVELASLKSDDFTKALLEKNLVFDFATQYFYAHRVASVQDFLFTDADYAEFRQFVAKNYLQYELPIEKTLKSAAQSADFKGLSSGAKRDYETLLQRIQQEKAEIVDRSKSKLTKELKDELIKRYFYREGLYAYYLKNDEAVQRAVSILANPTQYEKILKP